MTSYSQQLEMADRVHVEELTEQYLDETVSLLVNSFLALNPIWKKYNYSYETVFPILRAKIIPSVPGRWSYVLIKNGKVIGTGTGIDFKDQVQTPAVESKLELFTKLGKAGKELESQIDMASFKRGEAIYGPYAVIDPKEASQGYSLKFWWECFAYGKVAGYKYYYSRISSAVSLRILLKLGAEIVAETTVEGEENEKLWMIRMDLNKPFPNYAMMEAMTQRKPREKASL